MVGEILAGLGAFKAMLDVAKGLKDLNDAAARNAVAIDLQEKILTAQEQQSTLIERVRTLEKEMARFEAWDAEKQRYELKKLPPGVHVYSLKAGAANGEPAHDLCANCYQQGKKSILNSDEPNNGITRLHCPSCGWHDRTGHFQRPQVHRGPSRSGNDWMGT